MNNYTKHEIIRVKDLTASYFEIVFKKNNREFNIGSTVSLYGYGEETGDRHPLFIASEPSCGWVRVIADTHQYAELYTLKRKDCIKIACIENLLGHIHHKNSVFVVTDVGISVVFSLISQYPADKQEIFYPESNLYDRISVEYLKRQHFVHDNLDELKELDPNKPYYFIGNKHFLPLYEGVNVKDMRY